LLVDVVQL